MAHNGNDTSAYEIWEETRDLPPGSFLEAQKAGAERKSDGGGLIYYHSVD